MKREIIAFGDYYDDFMKTLSAVERKKVHYILDLLQTEDRISTKFVKFIRDGLYEIRAMYNGNIYRIFFIFDEGRIVVLFNGFQKKTQETPENEIKKALRIKEEYYERLKVSVPNSTNYMVKKVRLKGKLSEKKRMRITPVKLSSRPARKLI